MSSENDKGLKGNPNMERLKDNDCPNKGCYNKNRPDHKG